MIGKGAAHLNMSPNLSDTTMVSALLVKATEVGFLGSSLEFYDELRYNFRRHDGPFVDQFQVIYSPELKDLILPRCKEVFHLGVDSRASYWPRFQNGLLLFFRKSSRR